MSWCQFFSEHLKHARLTAVTYGLSSFVESNFIRRAPPANIHPISALLGSFSGMASQVNDPENDRKLDSARDVALGLILKCGTILAITLLKTSLEAAGLSPRLALTAASSLVLVACAQAENYCKNQNASIQRLRR
jgi:hypothetical protein